MAGGNTVTLTFAGDDRSLGKTLAKITSQISATQKASRSFRTAGIAALVTSIGPATGALVGLSGAIGVLPSMAFAGALGLGALAIGAGGFMDSMKNIGDPEAFVKTLEKLGPAAKETAIAVGMMKPEFDKMKAAVEESLFSGLADNVHAMGKTLFPVLQTQLVATAQSINASAKAFTGWLAAPGTVSDINTALDGSRGFLDGLLASLKPVSAAFLDIGVVAAPYMQQMGDAIKNAAERFETFVSNARETGQLNEWIQKGLDTFSALWEVLKTVGEAIWNIGMAFGESGFPSALQLVADGLLKMSEFIRENSALMVPLITGIGLFVMTAKLIAGLVGIFNTVKIAILGIRTAMLAFNLAMFASPITWIVLGIIALIAAIVLCIVYWDEIKAAAVAAWEWIKVKWGEAVAWLSGIWEAIKAYAIAAWNALKASVIEAVNSAVQWVIDKWNGAKAWLAGIWEGIKATAAAVWEAIKAWIARKVAELMAKVDEIRQLPGKVRDYFNRMKDWAIQKATELVNWVRGLPGRIRSALGNLGTLLVSAGRDLLNGLWNGISAGWGWLKGKVSEVASSLLATAKSALGIASPSKEFRDEVGHYLPEGLAEGIYANAGVAIQAAVDVANRAALAAQQAIQANSPKVMVEYGTVSQSVWDQLRKMGYRGRQGDNREALYVPQDILDQIRRGVPVQRVAYGSVSSQIWDQLRRMGYRGDPSDRGEAFYVQKSVLDMLRQQQSRGAFGAAMEGITGGARAAGPSTTVNVNVAGSIRSDRELVSVIRDEMDRGGFRGVR